MKLPIFLKLMLLASCVAGMQADFISLSIWERTTSAGEKQHLICLGDRHDLNSQADGQSDDLIHWLEQRNNAHDIVLIEDQNDVAYIIDQTRAYLKEHNKAYDYSCLQNVQVRYDDEIRPLTFHPKDDGLLPLIGQKLFCHKSIRSHNVDFRLLKNKLSCLPPDWQHFLENELHDFVLKQVIKEVQSYNDSLFLNSYYQQCIKPLCSILKESGSVSKQNIVKLLRDYNGKPKILNFLPHQDSLYYKLDCIEYGMNYNIYNRYALAQNLLCELMDARLLHHIYQEQIQKDQANVIVMCAGCAHIWNIETKLDRLGYARIYKDGASSRDDIIKKVSLSQRLKDSLNKILAYSARQAQIKRRMKHMLLDFDTDMDYALCPSTKQQAKL